MATASEPARPAAPTGLSALRDAMGLLGLATVPAGWSRALNDALPLTAARAAHRGLHDRFGGWLKASFFARHAPTWTLLAACLLLLASPYVGTGLNAALVLLSFACLAFQVVVTPPGDRRRDALDWPFVAMLLVSVAAVAFSPFLVLSLKGLAKMLVFWMSYFVFRSVLGQGRKAWWALFAALMLAAFVQAAYGVYQWKIQVAPLALWDDAEAGVTLTRVYGTLRNPNLLSGYLLPILPFAVAGMLTWRGLAWRLLGLATAITGAFCLYFTYSRGAYLGVVAEGLTLLAIGLLLGAPTLIKRPALMLTLGAVLLAVLAGGYWAFEHMPGLHERIASITATRTHSSNSFRLNVWAAVRHMIHDSWWAGIGLGNDAFRRAYALYMDSGFEALGAYNIFLEEAVEKGVFGLLVFLWLVGAMFARALWTVLGGTQRIWGLAAACALVGMLTHGLVDTVFYRPSVQILFWLVLAAIMCLPRRQEGAA